MNRIFGYLIVSLSLALGGVWVAAQLDLTTFQAGDTIVAGEVNGNFAALENAVEALQGGTVSTLNGKSGAVTLQGSGDVTIDDSGDGTIVIGATAAGGGDITSVVAGDGLTGGGEAGDVTLAADAELARDSEIVPTVLANDGSGSGLDADTLDGNDSGDFAAADHTHPGLPAAVGVVADFDGNTDPPTVRGGTGNFDVTYNASLNRYEIAIDGVSFSIDDGAQVTAATGTGDLRFASYSSVSGLLLVKVFDENGVAVRDSFTFTAYAF